MRQLHLHITFLLTMLMSMMGIEATAHDIEVANSDGVTIYYTWANNYTELSVSYRGDFSSAYEYTGSVVIPETVTYNGSIYSVTSIGDGAFYGCTGLTSVTIGNSVTSIGNYAFEYCSALTSVTIPNSVTSIGNYAFKNCSALTSVNIPNSVTSIGYSAFENCYGLTSVTIGNSVTSIGDEAFYGCTGLTRVDISDVEAWCNILFNDSSSNPLCYAHHLYLNGEEIKDLVIPNSVTSIGSSAFENCTGLTSVTIPNSVTSIGSGAFSGCTGLTSVTIPNSVTSIGYCAFEKCSALTSVTIPNSVTWISDSAFDNCYALTRVDISDVEAWCNILFNDSSSNPLWYAHHLYLNGEEIKDLVIPNSVTSIGDYAFENCSALTSVSIPNSVTSIGNSAFYGCTGLTSVTIPNSVTWFGNSAFNNCSALTSVTIPNSVTWISDSAFDNCSALTSLTIPNSVTSIESDAFSGCTGLTSLTIPNSVTSIGSRAFYGCTGLMSVTIPNSVTSIGTSAFYGCTGLTSVTIPNSVTSIGYSAFENCSALTSVSIPNSVTSIGNSAFSGTGIYANSPDGVFYVDKWACGYKGTMPSNTAISLKGGTVGIAGETFSRLNNLTSVNIPNSVTSIGSRAFYKCTGLTSVTIGNSVTSIGTSAFYGCTGLTSVTIGNSVTSIGSEAFYGCSSLKSVKVSWETPLVIGERTFMSSNYQNATLYVPKGTKAAYEAASVWRDFGTITEYEKSQGVVEVTDVSAIDNVIYMEPLEVTKGTEVVVPLKMKNTAQIRGFQFDLYLPIGVTVAKGNNGRYVASLSSGRLPEGSAHTLTMSEQDDGAIRFLCGSQYDETITGTEGEVATLKLCFDESMEDGQYPIVLKNVKLTETNINNFYQTETVQTALTVIAYTPGDISGDGVIDVSDYIGVANYILGEQQEVIIPAAADVNNDQVVDVSDYIGVANLILYNSIYGQTQAASRGKMNRSIANTDISDIDNVLYIEPIETTSNAELQLSLKMKNTAQIRGFQVDVYLPEGVTAVKNNNGRIVAGLNAARLPEGSAHTLTVSERPDGAIRLLCGSQYDETFTGNDGEIATLTINVANDVEAGNYPLTLAYVKLTETDIKQSYLTGEVASSFMVLGEPNGITSAINTNETDDYYDLQGRRVTPVKKGIYIRNGQKVIMK